MKRITFSLLASVLLSTQLLFAQGIDLTDRIAGAACDDAQYWYLVGIEGNQIYSTTGNQNYPAILQCDTWSTRGGKDGSNMHTPFMEYWKNSAAWNEHCNLPDAEIRHKTIKGLPAGNYKVSMRIRCYCEIFQYTAGLTGVYLYANGATTDVIGNDWHNHLVEYGDGAYIVKDAEVECTVGDDGVLDFGINVKGAEFTELNWVAWKDVKLHSLSMQEGTYYLQNKATGQFITGGGSWGTQAILNKTGVPITIEKVGNEIFHMSSIYANGSLRHLGIAPDNSGRIFMEHEPTDWTITSNNEGFFTIKSDYGYLGNDGYDGLDVALPNTESEDALWEFVSKETLIKELLNKERTDATFLITNAHIGKNIQETGWLGSSFGIGGYHYEYESGTCAEVWNSNFNIYQTLENIPNGKYSLKVKGFYRYNTNSENSNLIALESHSDGTEQLYAKLYAKSGATEVFDPLQSIASEIDNISDLGIRASNYGMPFSMEEAARAFSNGLYSDNEIVIEVTNNTLTIGIKKEQQDGCDWTIWDDFELQIIELGDNTNYDPNDMSRVDIDFEQATPESPVDATGLIKNADFSGSSGWTGGVSISGNADNNIANMSNRTFDINQTITNIPNGWYRLKAQGFYRYGDVQIEQHNGYSYNEESEANNVWAVYTIPYATITRKIGREKLLATLYGNNVEKCLPSIFEHAHEVNTHSGDFETELGWIPGNTNSAAEALMADEYHVEILVPVVNGKLKLGVKKNMGYKYDWTCWDNFKLEYLGAENLVYAEDIVTDASALQMNYGETRQLSAKASPTNASDTTITWTSSNTGIITVDKNGKVRACGTGDAFIYITANGSNSGSIRKEIPVSVSYGYGDAASLAINEIQVSNIDMFIDPSYNYGGYIELYNPTNNGVTLDGMYISDDPGNLMKHRLRYENGVVPAKGYGVIWFDHNEGHAGNVSFKMDMDGGTIYISDNSGNVLLSQTYPEATTRTSFARMTDGTGQWGITAYPTPGASNSGSKEIISIDADRLAAPTASPGSGFYQMSGFNVEVLGAGNIYFTTDGSVPTESNGQPIENLTELNGTTVLRLRAFSEGMLPSEVVTYTYCQSDINHTLPVLFVTANPEDLYSDDKGIFVTGTNGVAGSGIDFPCNWNREWDRAADMEFMSIEGNTEHKQEVNLSRFGGWSRSWYPYNFKLKAQKQYEGENYIEYPFFSGNKPYLKHKVLQVRNGGNDIFSRIKDAALHNIIISSGFYLDCQDYQSVHCYINGQYTGMLNLREPSNKHFGLGNYGIDTDEMDQMELTSWVDVKTGTSEAFYKWRDLSYSATDESAYEQIGEIVDIDEFANYMAAQLFLGGDDWPNNNCKAFKGHDGKFHIVMLDIDQALRFDGTALTRLSGFRSSPLIGVFFNMLENDKFRKQFIDAFCIVGGSVFEETRSAEIIDRMSAEMNPALSLEGLSTSPTADYMKSVITQKRCNTMMNALKNWQYAQLSDADMYQVKFSANIEKAALQINGQNVPTGKFSGALFAPSVLKANAFSGYTFKGWKNEAGETITTKEELDLATLTSHDFQNGIAVIEAVYEPVASASALKEAIATPIKINEVSAGNTVFADETWKRSDWIELHNTTDTDIDVAGLFLSDDIDQPLKYQIEKNNSVTNTIIPAGGHLVVWADGLGKDINFNQIHTNFKLGNNNGEKVIAVSSDAFVSNNASYFNAHPEMKSFIDGLTYCEHRGDQTVGRYPDGGKSFYRMGRPTIERTNTLLTTDSIIGEDENLSDILAEIFSLQLNQGWNWISHRLHAPVKVDELSNYATRIVGQNHETYRNGSAGMSGSLYELKAGNMYKVQMSNSQTFTSEQMLCDSRMTINLQPGWNWIGYPVDGSQTIKSALAGYVAEEGDKLIGQDGFTTFSDGVWTGTLTSFGTGKGYMLYTKQAKSFCFNTPDMAVNVRRTLKTSYNNKLQSVDKYAYPNIMGVIGNLVLNGTPVQPHQFTLMAYSDGECRGIGQWVNGRIYLTSYGEGGEKLEFYALDETTNELFPIVESLTFYSGINGTQKEPLTFNIGNGEATDIEEIMHSNSVYGETEGYYNLTGTLVSRKAAPRTKGIYIKKFQNGSSIKVLIK